LPGETPADFADSLQQALALGPDSITIHTLAIKRSSRLNEQFREAGGHPARPDPSLAAMLQTAAHRLKAAGLLPYYLYRQKDVAGGLENTGFARPSHGCLYNIGMMSDQFSVVGLGSGAMSKRVTGRRVERSPNPRDIADYIVRVSAMAARKLALFNSNV
jgi:oxygen-independent coproporphyrinogen-3 oxidase